MGIMVQVTADDKATLESWIRATTSEQRLVLRTLQKFIFCTTLCCGQRWSPSYPVGRNRPAFLVSADGQRGAKEEGHSQDGGRGYGGVLHPRPGAAQRELHTRRRRAQAHG